MTDAALRLGVAIVAAGVGAALAAPLRFAAARLSSAPPPPWPPMGVAGALVALSTVLMRPVETWGLAALLGAALLVLAAVDLAVLRLPDILTLPLGLLGMFDSFLEPPRLGERLLGWAVGLAALAALEAAYRRMRGRSGLGLGDAKLLAACGAWVGAAALPMLLEAACGGALVFVALRLLREGRPALSRPLPFGVFLGAALWLIWLRS